ncbi:Crp/Fnr family transcriptional regulator [Actinomycetaceae bacterium MB13-C1-2]|nr:Crp/Fnr family transcriptional regulator [Actinomycetaceae bacterium MB13-C1-2]
MDQTAGVDLRNAEELLSSTVLVQGKAGDQFYVEGEYHPYVYLVLQGFGQMSVSKGHNEVILGFIGPQEMLGSTGLHLIFSDPYDHVPPLSMNMNEEIRSQLMGETPTHSASALTEYLVARFDTRQLAKLAEREVAWAQLISSTTAVATARFVQKLRRQMTLPPQARYELMLEEQPEVVAAVQQRHIAQYLGITPEGLSRISSRLRKRASEVPEESEENELLTG